MDDHLQNVASLARKFAQRLDVPGWGEHLGRWHDIGKFSAKFQRYLDSENGIEAHLEKISRVDHSTAGAQHANEIFGKQGLGRKSGGFSPIASPVITPVWRIGHRAAGPLFKSG